MQRRPFPPGNPTYDQDHPLAAKIWLVSEKKFISAEELSQRIREVPYLLLGEQHDNADHHLIQAWLISQSRISGRKLSVAFEMFDQDQQPAIDKYLAENPNNPQGLGDAVRWQESGWPDWKIYFPIMEAAMEGRMPLIAASLPRSHFRPMMKLGPRAYLGVDRFARMKLDQPLPEAGRKGLEQTIIQGHCGMLPEAAVSPMVDAQRVKDALMAETMIKAANREGADGAILIAGNGHVRKDYGAPLYLAHQTDPKTIFSVGLLPVDNVQNSEGSWEQTLGKEDLPYDVVWFTPYPDNQDPCEKYADQLKKIGKGSN